MTSGGQGQRREREREKKKGLSYSNTHSIDCLERDEATGAGIVWQWKNRGKMKLSCCLTGIKSLVCTCMCVCVYVCTCYSVVYFN